VRSNIPRITTPGSQQMKLVREVPPNFIYELSISRIQLLFERLKDLRNAEKFPFDHFRMVAGSGSDLTFKPARTCQNTLRKLLVNKLGHSLGAWGSPTFTKSPRS
jgi:hypothetical protein